MGIASETSLEFPNLKLPWIKGKIRVDTCMTYLKAWPLGLEESVMMMWALIKDHWNTKTNWLPQNIPTNTPHVFHVETQCKRSFPCHFNVKYTWRICGVSHTLLNGSSLKLEKKQKPKPEKKQDKVSDVKYVMCCAIWYHLYNLKNVKNNNGEVLLLERLLAFSLQPY